MHTIFTEFRKGLKVFGANYLRHAFIFLFFPLVLGVLYGALYANFTVPKLTPDISAELDLTSPHSQIIELEPEPKMTSRENMLTSSFTGVSLFLAFTLTGIFLKSLEKRVVSRLMSISLNKWQLYVGNTLSAFIISFGLTLVYFIISYRLILNLKLNFLALILVIALHSAFLAAVHGFLISIFQTERSMRNITTPFIMMFMFLGGTIFPVDSFKGANNLAAFTPNYLLKNIYENLVLARPTVSHEVVILTVISLALLIGGGVLFSLREEV